MRKVMLVQIAKITAFDEPQPLWRIEEGKDPELPEHALAALEDALRRPFTLTNSAHQGSPASGLEP